MVKKKTAVLIPAFNASRTIAEVVLKSKKHCDEVVVFDDGSTDMTAEIATACGATVIKSETNRGKGFALRELFKHAKLKNFNIAVTIDADMQHNPEDIPKLLETINNNKADVVIGVRTGKSPLHRQIANKFFDKLANRKDSLSGFRAYSRYAINKIKITEYGYGVDSQILSQLDGMQIAEAQIDVSHNRYAHSKNIIRQFVEVFNFFFFKKPLLNLGLAGLTVIALSVIFGLTDVIYTWNLYHELALGTLLLTILAINIGALIFFVGVILHQIAKTLEKHSM